MAEEDTKPFLQTILRTHEKDDGLIITGVEVKDCSKPGDGFMSEVAAVDVVGRRGSGGPYSNSLFIKRQPSNAKRAELFLTSSAFSNEALAYCEVLPLITVGREVFPKCYYAGEDCIVLENLRAQGYQIGDKKKGMDLAESELVMKSIGNFHAFTYRMRLLKEEKFSQVTSELCDLLESKGDASTLYAQNMEASLTRGIEHLQLSADPTAATAITKLRQLQGKVVKTLRQLEQSELTVLCHGDFYFNNIMVSRENNREKGIKIIDLQVISPASPAADVWKFLYTSISPDLLNVQCDHLLSLYCTSFRETLVKLDTPRLQIPDESILKKELASRELYGLLVSMMYLPVLLTDFSNIPVDLDEILSDPKLLKERQSVITEGFTERLAALVNRCRSRNIL